MSTYLSEIQNDKEKREGLIWSILIHIAILLLFFIPLAKEMQETETFAGILVNFGEDVGDPAIEINEEMVMATKAVTKQSAPEESKQPSSKPNIIESKTSLTQSEMITASQKNKEKTLKSNEKVKATKPEESQPDPQEQEAAKLQAAKSKFGNLFGQNRNGDSQAEEDGDPFGVPGNESLQKEAKGNASSGEGLNGRGIIFRPTIQDNSQKKGKVMVELCVDKTGKVTSANFTQKGSTTTDNHLIQLAIDGAKKYKFSPSESHKQCGTITIDFVSRT